MRPLKLILAAVLFTMGALSASANSYSASVDSCENAIAERLGITDLNANYNIQKVKSRSRYRDINFTVSVFDEQHPVKGVKVKCRAKSNGTILAVEFDSKTLPASIAIN